MDAPPENLTRLFEAMDAGSDHAREAMLEAVYGQLRVIAAVRMADEAPGRTLQATELVHEAWLRLGGPEGGGSGWRNRRHFFSAAATAMRRILIEHARQRATLKRGAGREALNIESVLDLSETPASERVLALDAALASLEKEAPEAHQVVMLRFFTGLSVEECAEALDSSTRTVLRHWAFARAWLAHDLERD
ncbi:ECF-type sigma factor [Haloferula sp. BvORR071]|uniref:ECF-type sigma factor n=1 Tax=Haloferula sp. BvORR071 TaxID=1396141 RepID=UPI000553AB96|nr:ECF-type sigma factor [Haloferula sp. BvORR071]